MSKSFQQLIFSIFNFFFSERREFVMTEVKRGQTKMSKTRGTELDIQRAVGAARNPRESKFGECLLNVNTKEDPILKSKLRGITTEMRRMEFKVCMNFFYCIV